MSEVKTENKLGNKKLSKSALVLIIGLIIIAIPVLVFVGILGVSAMQTGTPREGSRFNGDLDPAITNSEVNTLKSDIEALGTFDSVEVILSEGQLRIYVDTQDSMSESQIDSLITNIYNKVNSNLPISTYFTSTDSKRMYDLVINVYTTAEASEIGATSSRVYKVLHKNAAEETYAIEDLAHPKDPDLAAELEGLKEPEEETSEETEESTND